MGERGGIQTTTTTTAAIFHSYDAKLYAHVYCISVSNIFADKLVTNNSGHCITGNIITLEMKTGVK